MITGTLKITKYLPFEEKALIKLYRSARSLNANLRGADLFPVRAVHMVTSTASSSDSATELTGGQSTSMERDRLLGSTASGLKYNTLDGGGYRHVRDETVGGASNAEDDEFDTMEQFELEERAKRPFYRRPSPWWYVYSVYLFIALS